MAAGSLSLLGVNLSGAEFGSGTHYGWDYTYPSHAEIDYYASKNLNVIRLPFLWERLQPTLDGGFDAAELGRIEDVVSYAATKGVSVVLDPHDYGGYGGNLIGSDKVPNSAFAAFWGELAAQFKTAPNVMFGLMNEPNQQSATTWLGSANAAIAAIRQNGAQQEILVPGSYWDGGASWTTSDNAKVIGTGVVDPANNYAFEVHQYLDSDGSGTHAAVVSTSIGVDRLTAITNWATQNGARLFLGEFSVAQDTTSLTAMNNMLDFMSQHADVWQGATYWGGGPWWGDYMYSIEPKDGVDKPQMAVLDAYAPSPPSQTGAVLAATSTVQTITALLATDTGPSSSDGVTSRAVLAGTTGANGTVHFTVDGQTIADTAVADATGAWSKDFSTLADGRHTVAAAVPGSVASVSFTLDTTSPTPTITTPSGMVAAPQQTLAGTGEAGSTLVVQDGTTALSQPVTVGSDGRWSTDVTLASVGVHQLSAVAVDAAGNRGTSAAVAMTYDHAPSIVSGGGGTTAVYDVGPNTRQIATIQAVDNDAGDTVRYALLGADGNPTREASGFVIDAATGALSFTGRPTQGLHSVTVTATDSFGASAVQNVKVNVGSGLVLTPPAGLGCATQTFVTDPGQRLTLVQGFNPVDTVANGATVPHGVLELAHSLFRGVTADSQPAAIASVLASHSLQMGQDTVLFTDKGQVFDLLSVNRQSLLAHPNSVAFA